VAKIVFPIDNPVYKSGSIREPEQQELASTHNLPLERLRASLQDLAALMEAGKIEQCVSMAKLRKTIRKHLEGTLSLKYESSRMRINGLHTATSRKYAVFMRSESGQSARFKAVHDTHENALEIARQHAATTAGHGNLDFTYYVVELKHRVGIENGKIVDEPMT